MSDTESPEPRLTVEFLRAMFRNLIEFRSFHEATGIDTINGPDGELISLFDIEEIYLQTKYLATRQRQAIDLFLVLNYREVDAAVAMGVSPTNPVAMYATDGLKKIIARIESGEARAPRKIVEGDSFYADAKET